MPRWMSSPPQEVGEGAAGHSRAGLLLAAGMPIPQDLQQDGLATVTELGTSRPLPRRAAEDGYQEFKEKPGATRPGKEFSGDNLLNMDKAVIGREGRLVQRVRTARRCAASGGPAHREESRGRKTHGAGGL